MASGLLDMVNSVLQQVGNIPFDWSTVAEATKSRPNNLFQLVRMWNNQVARQAQGTGYTFEAPACFLEIVNEDTSQFLDNVTFTDFQLKFHIVDMQLDAGDNEGMDQNLSVYGFRDFVKQYMVGFTPANCSTLFYIDEKRDYDHTDVYHYVVDCKCGFTDIKGSILDPDQTRVIYTTPPTALELTTGFSESGETPVDPLTSYIWEVMRVDVQVVTTPDGTTQRLGNGAVIPLQYALNNDGTLTIPYLGISPAVQVLIPFIVNGDSYDNVEYDADTTSFDATVARGGFAVGNIISFNASLPLI